MKVWLPAIRAGTGADVYTIRLARALIKRGIATEITWFSRHYEIAPFMAGRVRPDSNITIVHANSWNGFAFWQRGIPLVVAEHLYVHDPIYRPYKSALQRLYHSGVIKRFEKASFERANVIVAVSAFVASAIQWPEARNKVHIIHNWVDIDQFAPSRERRIEPRRPFRLLFIGNLSRRKGADLLAPVMNRLGQGFELWYTSEARIHASAHCGNMVPIGRLDEGGVVRALQECDALLFPSRFEGFGYAALEAMACGKPVIASNSSSLPEVVEDGVCGILCQPDDVDAFAEACKKLAEDPMLCRRMGEAARERAVRLFSEEVVVPKYIQLFEALSEGRVARR